MRSWTVSYIESHHEPCTLRNVLAVDDQKSILDALRLLLKSEGIACTPATSPAAALEALNDGQFDAALVDLNFSRDTTSGEEGLDLLRQLRQRRPDLPVVVMTAWGNVQLAVRAIQLGCIDFIEKPWENARLLDVLRRLPGLSESRRHPEDAGGDGGAANVLGELIARSPAMKQVMSVVARVAPSDANVLLLGENGTGKGVIARHLHNLSPRAEKPFVKINMGGISENLFESEMFGHVRGAFTDARGDRVGRFELANGGTLLLDEVGNMPISQQPKLLRVLEDGGEFERMGSSHTQRTDVRLIAATNADLEKDVASGSFRRDLLYRLNTIEITLPPLRNRSEDILPLAQHFLSQSAKCYGRAKMRMSAAAQRVLLESPWPGNVRQLQHVIERAVLLSDGDEIRPEALSIGKPAALADDLERMTLDDAEKWLIRRCLDRYDGNLQRCADALGITRQALYRRLEKYSLRATGGDG
ncbi:sigma-54 dependent transcriptional regulator [Xanthomonas sp. GPE 39]|uniref:sigma-54-dependent transcriptional regulator n=1 Tax=Xanthomonas sp. GPE 39 TaxID=1583099 RepID=UPI0005F2FA09|nr:sigma-54 dependent transcriptional regulator [Xanthomonas sp. GPE 39]